MTRVPLTSRHLHSLPHSLRNRCSLGAGNAAKSTMDQAHPTDGAWWWRQEVNSEINTQVTINQSECPRGNKQNTEREPQREPEGGGTNTAREGKGAEGRRGGTAGSDPLALGRW